MIQRWVDGPTHSGWEPSTPAERRRVRRRLRRGEASLHPTEGGFEFSWWNGDKCHLFHLSLSPQREREYARRVNEGYYDE